MDSLLRLIESYLHSRRAILRAIDDRSLLPTDLAEVLGKSYSLTMTRRRYPDTWRPSELIRMAEKLRLSSTAISSLPTVGIQLTCMPDAHLRRLLKESHLNKRKLDLRLGNSELWQYTDLVLLATTLRGWQDARVDVSHTAVVEPVLLPRIPA